MYRGTADRALIEKVFEGGVAEGPGGHGAQLSLVVAISVASLGVDSLDAITVMDKRMMINDEQMTTMMNDDDDDDDDNDDDDNDDDEDDDE